MHTLRYKKKKKITCIDTTENKSKKYYNTYNVLIKVLLVLIVE